jgi:ankyrin repeat protein
MVNALLSTADSSRMHEVKGNKDEKIIDNGDNENQDARAKRMAFINAKDVPGSTVLMAAAWQGNLSMVKLLIRSLRSNPNIVRDSSRAVSDCGIYKHGCMHALSESCNIYWCNLCVHLICFYVSKLAQHIWY